LVFEKNANFFAEYWQKSQKSVIIKSTPGVDFLMKKALAEIYGQQFNRVVYKFVTIFVPVIPSISSILVR
jgi:hypothetical protein